ncbi:hypothetical protein SB782_38150, partial [Brevibacillus sp. SIMBA_076]
ARFTDESRLHVSRVLPRRSPKGQSILGHALAVPISLRCVQGMPVPAPAEVWCQLAALLGIDDLVIAGDALLRRKGPL